MLLKVLILAIAIIFLRLLYNLVTSGKCYTHWLAFWAFWLIVLISIHQYLDYKEQKRIKQLLVEFEKNQTLICQERKVNKKTYNYEPGTMVFISKKFKSVKYSINKCKLTVPQKK